MDLQGFGRMLIFLGVALAIVGGLMLVFARLGIGSLPGDVRIQSQGWGCYVPIVASIVISIFLTIVLNLLLRWFR